MTTSLILDFETLDNQPSSVIHQIGIIAVHRETFTVIEKLALFPYILPQLASGRTYSSDTITWAEKNNCMPVGLGQSPLEQCLRDLHAFIANFNPNRIWAWGKDFERPLLEHASRQHHIPIPEFQFRKFACGRDHFQTAFGMDAKTTKRTHHALQDTIDELRDIHAALKELNRLQSF